MVRVARIELASQPWEGRVMPLNHTRVEPPSGIEPLTYALRMRRSTN